MLHCSSCGVELRLTARVCVKCGQTITDEERAKALRQDATLGPSTAIPPNYAASVQGGRILAKDNNTNEKSDGPVFSSPIEKSTILIPKSNIQEQSYSGLVLGAENHRKTIIALVVVAIIIVVVFITVISRPKKDDVPVHVTIETPSKASTNSNSEVSAVSTPNYARCAGSYEPERCNKEEAALASETPEQKIFRINRLEFERAQNMAAAQMEQSTSIGAGESEIEQSAVTPIPLPVQGTLSTSRPECTTARSCVELSLTAASRGDVDAVRHLATIMDANTKPDKGNRRLARQLNKTALDSFKREDYSDSIQKFRLAQREDPRDVEIASNLGFALVRGGRAKESVAVLQAALILEPRRSSSWTPLAEALALLGRADEAQCALWIAFQWSGNRDKSLAFYQDRSNSESQPQLQALYRDMVKVATSQMAVKN